MNINIWLGCKKPINGLTHIFAVAIAGQPVYVYLFQNTKMSIKLTKKSKSQLYKEKV